MRILHLPFGGAGQVPRSPLARRLLEVPSMEPCTANPGEKGALPAPLWRRIFPPNLRTGDYWKKTALLLVVHFLAAALSTQLLTHAPTQTALIWIPAGVDVALLFFWGYQLWLGMALVSFSSSLVLYQGWGSPSSLLLATGLAASAVGGRFLAVFLIKPGRAALARPEDVIRFLVFGCFLSHLPGAILYAALLYAFGMLPVEQVATTVGSRWRAEAFGILLFAPLLLGWWGQDRLGPGTKRRLGLIEAGAMILLVLLLGGVAFRGMYPVEYGLLPVLLWGAFRFRGGASLLVALVAVLAAHGTARGTGPFARG
jgi:integral membrane sensor domain MASE1